MEFLLMIQPVCEPLAISSGILLVCGLIAYVIMRGVAESERGRYRSENDQGNDLIVKSLRKLTLIMALICFVTAVPAASWQGYKNVLMYRAINSETTGKTVKNINLIMDEIEKRLTQ